MVTRRIRRRRQSRAPSIGRWPPGSIFEPPENYHVRVSPGAIAGDGWTLSLRAYPALGEPAFATADTQASRGSRFGVLG